MDKAAYECVPLWAGEMVADITYFQKNSKEEEASQIGRKNFLPTMMDGNSGTVLHRKFVLFFVFFGQKL